MPAWMHIANMVHKSIKRVFRFNKRERWGLLALLVTLFGLFGLSSLFPPRLPHSLPGEKAGAINSLKIENQSIESSDSKRSMSPILPFDPNLISETQWVEMGISARTARTIGNYLSKGGRFRSADDLQKIWGMDPLDCERLMPFVKIADRSERFRPPTYQGRPFRTENRSFRTPYPRKEWQPRPGGEKEKRLLDINRVDTTQWEALPGIGSGYARRILRYRSRLGGFIDPEQIGETYQLPDSVFQRIRPFLSDSFSGSIHRLSLNTIVLDSLGRHPYCGYAKAKLIVRYREQHGPFQKIEELLNIATIDGS